MAKFFRSDAALILVPAVEENLVQVILHDLLFVTNAVATMEAVSKSVRKPTMDTAVHAFLDIRKVEVHVRVCEY